MNNDIKQTFDKIIECSNYIESFYQKLADEEFENGIDSELYKILVSKIEYATEEEYKLISDIINSDFCIYFKDYVIFKRCTRLIDKLNDEYDFTKKIVNINSNMKYLRDKNFLQRYLTQEEYVKNDYEEEGKHIVRHNIFNLIQSKMYIKILDEYISNIKENDRLKKTLITEKYETIQKNTALESWYFQTDFNLDALLADSDILVSLELNMLLDEYLRLKNQYFDDVVKNCVDIMLEEPLNDEISKSLYEINLVAALLCMNVPYLAYSYDELEEDMEKNSQMYNKDVTELVEKVYSKCPELEKKLRVKCPLKEV